MIASVVITARPSYARVQSVIQALHTRGVTCDLVVAGAALLERYGRVVDVIRTHYPYAPRTELFTTYEGATHQTTAKETGALLTECASHFARVKPEVVIVHADRHEVLAPAMAAAYQHIPLVHLQAGERSGSIDDKVRDAITALSDLQCCSTLKSADRVKAMLGDKACIALTGCPSIDLAAGARTEDPVTLDELGGAGDPIDLAAPFIVMVQHADTYSPSNVFDLMSTLQACDASGYQTVVLWPGQDADAEAMAKAIRVFRSTVPMHTVRNLPPHRFLRLLTQAKCLVGNSSVGIRECAYLGVPVVNIGNRQAHRERAGNVLDVPLFDIRVIQHAITHQAQRAFTGSPLYGVNGAGDMVADAVVQTILGARAAATPKTAVA
jgi:UDP-hydrolysing UDP-N-acetyl-D-glucosamine 2-epimerase